VSKEAFDELLVKVHTISDLAGAAALLGWDQRTHMPQGGAGVRSERMATLVSIIHQMMTSDEMGEVIERAQPPAEEQGAESFEGALHRVVKRRYDKTKLIPTELSVERQRASSSGYQAWRKARTESDYAQFRDALQHNIDLTKETADALRSYFPDADEDYDILLDDYEEGMKTSDIVRVFDDLKGATRELVAKVAESGETDRDAVLKTHFPAEQQEKLVRTVVNRVGFTDDAYNLAETTHPFESSMAINDIRITTKYDEGFFNPSFFGTLHEFGHGLYEHQISEAYERTPLARGVSMAWHESQSRMMENLVGRGRPFWNWAMPEVQRVFPDQFAGMDADDMYRAVNAMGPSLIRIEADELTYNLHIIIRFELERDLLSGNVTIDTLPEAWRAKFRDYFGIDVPNDAEGVLQDVHWSQGSFGYFPTYALGNVLGAMLWTRINAELPDLEDEISRGELQSLRAWLKENIHQHGSFYTPNDLLDRVLGTRQLDAKPLISYLTAKVDELYG
jgi:carboxypeptidase Taq